MKGGINKFRTNSAFFCAALYIGFGLSAHADEDKFAYTSTVELTLYGDGNPADCPQTAGTVAATLDYIYGPTTPQLFSGTISANGSTLPLLSINVFVVNHQVVKWDVSPEDDTGNSPMFGADMAGDLGENISVEEAYFPSPASSVGCNYAAFNAGSWTLVSSTQAPPVASAESASTPANTPVSIDLTAGATGSADSAAIVSGPAHGTVSGPPGTIVTYTPVAGFSGTDTFSFDLSNTGGTSNVATAAITVVPQAPVAADQTTSTLLQTPISIDLTAGATGSPTSAALVGIPVNGTVGGFPSTTVTFTPAPGFHGQGSFQFTLANSAGTSNTATVTIAVNPPSGTLSLLSPFLLHTPLNDLALTSFLPNLPSTAAATGLLADNVSAAIAVFQTNVPADVTLTVNNGTTITTYSDDFLTLPPSLGSNNFIISANSLTHLGSNYYAFALIQSPAANASYSFSSPITVTASQDGSVISTSSLTLLIPPLILVHGLWGSATSLQTIQNYLLLSNTPWAEQTDWVQPVQYPNAIAFNNNDPGGPFDVLETQIDSAITTMQAAHVVGGRVDLVAHSMGGLVARHYLGRSLRQNTYYSLSDRNQGKVHEIITIDTPETGSQLAAFLATYAHSPFQAPEDNTKNYAKMWTLKCLYTDNVKECFDKLKLPLAPDGVPLRQGAVYSLIPGGQALQNLPSPNFPNAQWLAISAVYPAPGGAEQDTPPSLLRKVTNLLIKGIYPNPALAETGSQILGDQVNDVIVTKKSQLHGGPADEYNFHDLAHTGLGTDLEDLFLQYVILNFSGSDDNVLTSPAVAQLVACWLSTNGDTSCKQSADSGQARSGAARYQAVSDSEDSGRGPALRKMTLLSPSEVQFGTPTELTIQMPPGVALGSSSITVYQSTKNREHLDKEEVTAVRQAGQTLSIPITPRGVGAVEFTVASHFSDGSGGVGSVTINVEPSMESPVTLRGDMNLHSLTMRTGSGYTLHPVAVYKSSPTKVRVDGAVKYSLIGDTSSPPLELRPDGMLIALHPGKATVEVRLGEAVDQIEVDVKSK